MTILPNLDADARAPRLRPHNRRGSVPAGGARRAAKEQPASDLAQPPRGGLAGQKINFTRNLKSALLATAVVLAAAIAGLAIGITNGQDRLALDASHRMVEGAFKGLADRTEILTREHAFRDETYRAVQTGDEEWIYANLAARAGTVHELSVIVEPASRGGFDQDRFGPADVGQERGERADFGWRADVATRAPTPGLIPPAVLAGLDDQLDTVPATARAAASSYAWIDGELWLLAISRIGPRDHIAPDVADATMPRLVMGKRLSPELLDRIGAPFLVSGLKVTPDAAPGGIGVALRDAGGTVLGHATWAAPTPGWRVFAAIGAPAALVTAVTIFVLVVAANHLVESAGRLENALVRARQANRAKSDFVATVSHELRTPVTSIMGSLDLIASGALSGSPEKAAEIVDIARTNSRRLATLIEDLLQIQKMETGNLDYHFEPVAIGTAVEQAIRLTRPIAGNTGIEIKTPAPLPPLHVRADQSRLEQVITNILSNAVKFSHPGSEILVDVIERPSGVRVSVADHGIGIPDGARDRVFAPFGQIDSSDTRSAGGTGLGLNIAKRIMEAHRGLIDYRATPGGGTTFYIELPRAPAPA
ncbi:MAG: hypothetical protein KDK53_16960 [Maritimibacter sp.]|nr:hypothetical protein [Maritimibacter sp.]